MGFNLADILQNAPGVSNLDTSTGKDQIEYISIDLIVPHEKNFYQITDADIDKLANNILLAGLQQPLRVRQMPGDESQVVIISGHRRYTALKKLVSEGHEEFADVPCIVEESDEPMALTELKLILANSDTRKTIPADLDKQQVRLEDLLNELKGLGYEFPGRTRDYVAQLCNTSASRLARLKVIREKLAVPLLREKYEKGKLNESLAYKIAQQSEDFQKICSIAVTNNRYFFYSSVEPLKESCEQISQLQCAITEAPCQHAAKMMSHTARTDDYSKKCRGCCANCHNLADCKDSCQKVVEDKAKALHKLAVAEEKRKEKLREDNKPYTDLAKLIYSRIRRQLEKEGISLDDYLSGLNMGYATNLKTRIETGVDFDGDYYTPSGLGPYVRECCEIIKAAQKLNCSVDYLLGLSDSPRLLQQPDACGWRIGDPPAEGRYLLAYRDGEYAGSVYAESLDYAEAFFDEQSGWIVYGCTMEEAGYTAVAWMELPSKEFLSSISQQPESPLNHACQTGLSPSGHCGAAACCSETYSCCAQCEDPCNSRCGWLVDAEGMCVNLEKEDAE